MPSISTSNLFSLKCQADFAASMARLGFKKWLDLHRRLTFLRADCTMTWFYASIPLHLNVKILADCTCKPIRACLKEVMKVQRDSKKAEKAMKEWAKKEKKHHACFVRMAGWELKPKTVCELELTFW
jgi:hypothetical protein